MSNEQTMIQNNYIYTNNVNSIKIKSFQSLPSPQLLQQTQSPYYQQYTNIDIKQPNINNSNNGEYFSYPSLP